MRELEHWRDKVELSLDGRQVFFLFFGSAALACLIFVAGVLVGRRIEHGAAAPAAAEDPLAALDQLEAAEEPDDGLTFKDVLAREDKRRPRDTAPTAKRGPAAPLSSSRVDSTAHAAAPARVDPTSRAAVVLPSRVESRVESRVDSRVESAVRPRAGAVAPHADMPAPANALPAVPAEDTAPAPRLDDLPAHAPAPPVPVVLRGAVPTAPSGVIKPAAPPTPPASATSSDPLVDPAAGHKHASTHHHDAKTLASAPHAIIQPAAPAAARPEGRFTLQLSSFADRKDAEEFAAKVRATGYPAQVVPSQVPGKGTFFRVRAGSYPSRQAAGDAKVEYERARGPGALVAPL